MKNKLIIFLVLLVINIIFFFPLLPPNSKLIVTPEFSGGDTNVVYYSYRKNACDSQKKIVIPFWNRHIGMGYPVLGEGEIGFFNPFNLITCAALNYKDAFNATLFLQNLFGQYGFVLLALELGMTVYSGIFLAMIFCFSPIIVMNYMQVVLVLPFLYLGFILTFLIRFIKKNSLLNFSLLTLFISLQFISSHFQSFFQSYILILIFTFGYLFFNKTEYKTKKEKLLLFLFLHLSYILVFLLTAFHLFPSLEFISNSNRSASDIYGSYGTNYDQNLTVKSLITLISPYLSGSPKNATYDFEGIHPWESNFSIFTLPFLFLIYFLFVYKKINKNLFIKPFLLTLAVITLLAFGKNSPIYFIHSLPIFNSLRFPSRFVMLVVFCIAVLSAFGFDYLIKKNKFKNKIIYFILTIVFIEAVYFFNYFHVFLNKNKVYESSILNSLVKKQKDIGKVYLTGRDIGFFDKKYVKEGYQQNPDWYYQVVNNLLASNLNSIYSVTVFGNKSGPQLKRLQTIYQLVSEKVDDKLNSIEFDQLSKNVLLMSQVKYIASSYILSSDFASVLDSFIVQNKKFYFYKINQSFDQIVFYQKFYPIDSLLLFQKYAENIDFSKIVLLEGFKNENINLGEAKSTYSIIKDENSSLKLEVKTDNKTILYLPRNYYPFWKAYIDNKETKIYKANFTFMAIVVPKGSHVIDFRIVPEVFNLGVKVSFMTGFLLLFGYISLRGTSSYFFKRR